METAPFLTGQLLLAMPGIGDPRFARAVIAMCSHDGNGALGVGVGAHLPGVTLHGLLRQLQIEPGAAPDVPVHAGGPVEPNRGFVVHSADWGGEGSVDVAGRWALTSTLDVLRAIADGRGPTRWLVALGYAGWGAGQLDEEMTRNGWLGVEGRADILYDTPVERRWAASYALAGIDVRLLSAEAGHA